MMKGWLLTLIAAFGLAGCAGLRQFPEVAQDHNAALVNLDKDYANALKEIYSLPSVDPSQKRALHRFECT